MALNTEQINHVLKNCVYTRMHFLGTFPSCVINNDSQKREYSWISNTSDCSDRGQHWCAWYVKDNVVTFFDSFGRSPLCKSLPHDYKDMVLNYKSFRYSKRQLQDFNSFTCGHFSIHFILTMSLGLDINSFLKEYSNDKNKNDVTVLNIINSII